MISFGDQLLVTIGRREAGEKVEFFVVYFPTNFTFLDRSNFLGTKFTIYDGQPPHAGATVARSRSTRLVGLKQVSPRVPPGNYPVAQIAYELNVLGSR